MKPDQVATGWFPCLQYTEFDFIKWKKTTIPVGFFRDEYERDGKDGIISFLPFLAFGGTRLLLWVNQQFLHVRQLQLNVSMVIYTFSQN